MSHQEEHYGFKDPSTWRLKTATGIPYKVVQMTGSFEEETGSITVTVLIQSAFLFRFLQEFFPPPLRIGNLNIPQGKSFPGFPNLIAQRISFKSHDESVPIDPFFTDLFAPNFTYYPVVELDIEYGPRELAEPDENDPTTFLDISASSSGQYIHAAVPGAVWEGDDGQVDPNRNPNVPLIITVPTTDWTIKWRSVPFDFYENVLIHRLRALAGKVNSLKVPALFGAPPETLLFVGHAYNQSYTWKEGFVNAPPGDIEMRVVEKNILDKGKVRGHNDVWRPETGWQRLLLDGGTRASYEAENFNFLFSPFKTPLDPDDEDA